MSEMNGKINFQKVEQANGRPALSFTDENIGRIMLEQLAPSENGLPAVGVTLVDKTDSKGEPERRRYLGCSIETEDQRDIVALWATWAISL